MAQTLSIPQSLLVAYSGFGKDAIGHNSQMIILTVVYIEREDRIRLISARRSTKQEKELYYE
jgi:uncharacterized DUF497 family protein